VFDKFDTNRNNRLSIAELDNVLHKLNIKLTREQFANLLRDADRDGKFIFLMQKTKYLTK
jgi:Ca2+-binding EF-hand superfamily protein